METSYYSFRPVFYLGIRQEGSKERWRPLHSVSEWLIEVPIFWKCYLNITHSSVPLPQSFKIFINLLVRKSTSNTTNTRYLQPWFSPGDVPSWLMQSNSSASRSHWPQESEKPETKNIFWLCPWPQSQILDIYWCLLHEISLGTHMFVTF